MINTLDFLPWDFEGRGHHTGRYEGRDVDPVQEILAAGPGDALVQNPKGSTQVLLQVKTDQR